MAYTITGDCIECGACLPVCPTSCITEGSPYTIKPDDCVSCDACAGVCPVDACVAA